MVCKRAACAIPQFLNLISEQYEETSEMVLHAKRISWALENGQLTVEQYKPQP